MHRPKPRAGVRPWISRELPTVTTAPTDPSSLRGQVDAVLAAFVDARARSAAAHGFPVEIAETSRDFLFSGGSGCGHSRASWQSAGAGPVPGPVVQGRRELRRRCVLCRDGRGLVVACGRPRTGVGIAQFGLGCQGYMFASHRSWRDRWFLSSFGPSWV